MPYGYAAATDMSADALIILTQKQAFYKYGREWPMYTDIALTGDMRLGGGGGKGVLLRNVSAAPICDQFTVVAPGCWIREPVPILT